MSSCYLFADSLSILCIFVRFDTLMESRVEETVLIHVPVQSTGEIDLQTPTLKLKMTDRRLAVLVPVACRLSALNQFLETSLDALSKMPGKNLLVISWTYCADTNQNFSETDLRSALRIVHKTAPSVILKIVQFEGSFSRSKALNAALTMCHDDDVAVFLDADMLVKVEFFLNCKALARLGHTAYFPIIFSRYNPLFIDHYASNMNYSTNQKKLLGQLGTISRDTGIWRDFGFGMVSMVVADIRRLGMMNTNFTQWGMEDVEFFQRAQNGGLMLWRMHDRYIVHRFHEKTCEELKNSDRYFMCLRSKFRAHGNINQVPDEFLQ